MALFKKITLACLAFFIFFCALVWLISPWLVRSFAADSLAQHNITMQPESTVRLNLFISRLSVSNVTLEQNTQNTLEVTALQVDYSLWRLLKKEVHIQRVALSGVTLEVERTDDNITVAGFSAKQTPSAAPITPEEKPVTEPGFVDSLAFFAPEVILENITVNINNNGNPHYFKVRALKLLDTQYLNQELLGNVSLLANADGTSINTQGEIKYSPMDSALQLSLTVKDFQPTPYHYLLPPSVNKLEALFNAAITLNINMQDQKLVINSGKVDVGLAKLKAEDTVFAAVLDAFHFSLTQLTGVFNLETQAFQAQANINTNLNALTLGLSQEPATLLALKTLDSGDIHLALNNNTGDQEPVLSYQLTGEQLSLTGLSVSKASEELAALFEMDDIHFKQIKITPEIISLESIALGKGAIDINFDENGQLLSLIDTALLTKDGEEDTSTVTPEDTVTDNDTKATHETAAENTVSPSIQLQKLYLTAPLNIAILDRRHSQVFNKNFEVSKIDIGPVDSASVNTKTQLLANLKDHDYFTGELTGWITPFSTKINADTQLTLKEFPLHEVAPYLKDSLGFEVKAGQLDLNLKGAVKDDLLSSKSVMLMRGTEFGASEKVNENNVIGQTAIPLNVALNMLKDDQGNIQLTIPVNGDIHDPSFGVHYVVGLVMKKVVMSQAKKYLLNMFVPYAQVVSVAMSAGSYALKVRFSDLPFTNNQIDVGEEQQVFITQMTALMKDKKELQVQVCPVATLGELSDFTGETLSNEQHTTLLKIAEKRAQAFKAALVKQGGIESSRLLLCSPSVDKNPDAVPHIKFET